MEALGLDEPPWASTVLKSMVFIMQIASRPVPMVLKCMVFTVQDEPRCFRHIGFMTQNASRLIESIPRTPVLVHKTDRGYSDDSSSAIQNDRASSTVLKAKAFGVQMSSRFIEDVPKAEAPAFRNASRFIDDETVRTLL